MFVSQLIQVVRRGVLYCSVLMLDCSGMCLFAQPRASTPSADVNAPIPLKVIFDGTLGARSEKQFPVEAEAGDYVRGEILGQQVSVRLLDRKAHPIRLLVAGDRGRQEFQFVVGDQGPYQFQLTYVGTDQAAAAVRLQLKPVIPVAGQIAPPMVLESPRLRALRDQLRTNQGTDTFWKQVEATSAPLVEREGVIPPLPAGQALVTFLWRGAKRRATIFAAPSGDHDEMQRLESSDVWYRSYRVPETARIGYKLAPDIPEFPGSPRERRVAILATAQRDPLNPLSHPARPVDDFDGESVVELPGAPVQPWLELRPDAVAGQLSREQFSSQILSNRRDVYLYRPAGYQSAATDNCLLVIFDGDRYIDDLHVPRVLDNLIAARKIPATAAILITNPDNETRSTELPCHPAFVRFLAEELLPWAKTQGLSATGERTVAVGASYGGLAAAYAGLMRPDLFGNVYSQSGSFWWSPGGRPGQSAADPEWLTQQFVQAPVSKVRFYLEAGLFEDHHDASILRSTRHLRDVLQARGYPVHYHEGASGHGYFYWRYTFPNGISHLLGPHVTPSTDQ